MISFSETFIVSVTSAPSSPVSGQSAHSPDLNLIPPQIRRLMREGMEMRAGATPLSPLRRYVGRVHRKESQSSIAYPATPDRVRKGSPTGDFRAEVDLEKFLRTPPVSIKDSISSPSSSYGTPRDSAGESPDVENSQKSIMKVSRKFDLVSLFCEILHFYIL